MFRMVSLTPSPPFRPRTGAPFSQSGHFPSPAPVLPPAGDSVQFGGRELSRRYDLLRSDAFSPPYKGSHSPELERQLQAWQNLALDDRLPRLSQTLQQVSERQRRQEAMREAMIEVLAQLYLDPSEPLPEEAIAPAMVHHLEMVNHKVGPWLVEVLKQRPEVLDRYLAQPNGLYSLALGLARCASALSAMFDENPWLQAVYNRDAAGCKTMLQDFFAECLENGNGTARSMLTLLMRHTEAWLEAEQDWAGYGSDPDYEAPETSSGSEEASEDQEAVAGTDRMGWRLMASSLLSHMNDDGEHFTPVRQPARPGVPPLNVAAAQAFQRRALRESSGEPENSDQDLSRDNEVNAIPDYRSEEGEALQAVREVSLRTQYAQRFQTAPSVPPARMNRIALQARGEASRSRERSPLPNPEERSEQDVRERSGLRRRQPPSRPSR